MLPEFKFHSVELHLDREAHHQELYRYIQHTQHHNRRLGTRVWWGVSHQGEARCVKEFFRADPGQYRRDIPDPIWRNMPAPAEHTGKDRGLRGQRAKSYDERTYVPMDTATLRAIGQDSLFRDHFNAYAFELDALLTQFAKHYGYRQIVQAHRWGPVVMEDGLGPRGIVEMERLEPLPPPRVGDYLSIMNRVLEMMSAVTQLHAMAIPVRCYPPELVRDMELARQNPITRAFHYDLSPDQFLLRPGTTQSPEQVVLIDFNSSRMAYAEYHNFFWYAIPGKDYFQPPERRRLQDYRDQNQTFQSSPVYDLYALLTIALFYLLRQSDDQTKPSHLPGWQPSSQWQQWLQTPDLVAQLKRRIPHNRGIDPTPILELIAATLPHPPQQRRQALLSLSYVDWPGLEDWMLVPKAMNAIARYSLGREFQVGWYHPQIDLAEGHTATSLCDLLHPEHCRWQPGPTEQGRIDHPPLDLQQIYFIQDGGSYPIVRNGKIEPEQAGQYKVYAVWRGCVDFANPLHINIQPYRSQSPDDNATRQLKKPKPLPPEPTPFVPPQTPDHFLTPDPGLQTSDHPRTPDYDRTIVEVPIPVYNPNASTSRDDHTLGPSPNMFLEPMPELSPRVFVGEISHPEEQTSDEFWEPPPLQSTPPDSYTVNYSREKHEHAQSLYEEISGPSSGEVHPYDNQLPSGSVAHDVANIAANIDPTTPSGSLDDWLMHIASCSQMDDLNRCEDEMIMQFGNLLPTELVVQAHTRRCELAMAQNDLSLGWPSLNAMIQMLRSDNISKLHTGVLLNNLTVYCYMWAWNEKRLPVWDTQVGLDPLSHLKHWMQLSEPPGQVKPPAQMQTLRKRSRETIACALQIKRALHPQ